MSTALCRKIARLDGSSFRRPMVTFFQRRVSPPHYLNYAKLLVGMDLTRSRDDDFFQGEISPSDLLLRNKGAHSSQSEGMRGIRAYSANPTIDAKKLTWGKCQYSWDPSSVLSNTNSIQVQQARHMGRKGGASAFSKPRPPTRKQMKRYRRKKRAEYHEMVGKHSPHGSKRAERKKFRETSIDLSLKNARGEFLPMDLDPEFNTYTDGHAMIEDLMGNSASMHRTETPRPAHLAYRYEHQLDRIKGIMSGTIQSLSSGKSEIDGTSNNSSTTSPTIIGGIPSDDDLSLLVRAYRDKFGSRRKPVGVPKALEHLFDLGIPTRLFNVKTFTSLMTCAASPSEARQVLNMMKERKLALEYAFSILIDKHAKRGDFHAAKDVLDEMSREGIQPGVPSYTSLIAACHKAVSKSRVSPRVKKDASDVGWEAWKEMRIIGLNADAMAFGAIIRLFAARGQPERCINFIHEMETFEVLPTTLIFTAALHAVARSHRIALLFEKGWSRKNMRRNWIAAHHGKMCRKIVIMAENAEVEHDDGFISALILCAAAAGDSASAKAILLASDVRRMDHLRSIGSNEHLAKLRPPEGLGDGIVSEEESEALKAVGLEGQSMFAQRGTKGRGCQSSMLSSGQFPAQIIPKQDNRKLRALLFACAQSTEARGLGDLWTGRDSKGFLCDKTQARILTRQVPKYRDNSIPGLSSMEAGLGSLTWDDTGSEPDGKRLRRKKSKGFIEELDAGNTLDDIDPKFAYMFEQENADYQDDSMEAQKALLGEGMADGISDDGCVTVSYDNKTKETVHSSSKDNQSHRKKVVSAEFDDTEMDVDDDQMEVPDGTMMFRTKDGGQIFSNGSDQSSNDSVAPTIDDLNLDLQNRSELERRSAHAAQQVGDSDRDALEWDDRTDAGGFAPFGDSDPSVVNKIHMEYQQHGAERVDEGDLKEWSSALKELREPHDREYGPTMSDVSESALSLEDIHFGYPADLNDQRRKAERSFRDEFDDYHDDEGFDIRENTATNSEQMKGGREVEQIRMMQNEPADYPEGNGRVLESQIENQVQLSDSDSLWDEQLEQSIDSDSESGELDIFERSLPPGLPKSRIRKIRKVFEGTLGDPSMLNLIPLLRENIPEDVTLKWLRQKNLQNAYFVIEKAREDKTVDVQFLNNALQVVASSGSIGRALSFHAVEFGGYGMTPNSYSDRIIVDMLLKRSKSARALKFKDEVELEGRTLDLIAYGSLVGYFANRNELGSALMLVRECMQNHGYPPGEASLKKLRLLSRQCDLDERIGLVDLIGEDPLAWLRYGEAHLKREYSKKGRRGVLEAENAILRI